MWIVNIIKFMGIILKPKDIGSSQCIYFSIETYHQILQIALTYIVIILCLDNGPYLNSIHSVNIYVLHAQYVPNTLFSSGMWQWTKADRVPDCRLIILDKNLKFLVMTKSLLSCLYPCDKVQMLESGPLYVIPSINSIISYSTVCMHNQIFRVSVTLPLL